MVGVGGAEVKGPSISDMAAVALQIRLEILKKNKKQNGISRQGKVLKSFGIKRHHY